MRIQSLFLTTLLVTGCASTAATQVSKYSVVEADLPYSFYESAIPFVVSEGKRSRMTLGPAALQGAGDRQVFVVEVVNLGDTPFNVGPESFAAFTDKGANIRILTPEALQSDANRQAKRLAATRDFAIFANSLFDQSDGISTATKQYSESTDIQYKTTGSLYGSGGRLSYRDSSHGTATTVGRVEYSFYDADAAARGRQALLAENLAIEREYFEKIRDALENAQFGGFERQTVPPGQPVVALITVDPIPLTTSVLSFEGKIAGETHSFAWDYAVE